MEIKQILYNAFSLVLLFSSFGSGILCLINSSTYSVVLLGILLEVLSVLLFAKIVLSDHLGKYIVLLFPFSETHMGLGAVYFMMGLACFSEINNWINLVTGVLMLFLGIITTFLVKEGETSQEALRLKK